VPSKVFTVSIHNGWAQAYSKGNKSLVFKIKNGHGGSFTTSTGGEMRSVEGVEAITPSPHMKGNRN